VSIQPFSVHVQLAGASATCAYQKRMLEEDE
jgi:hypothetical protein